jgi:hypothetical protein
VLAGATFSSVRSANRAARSAERSLLVGLRPVLFSSRLQDPDQKIRWMGDHWAALRGGGAVLDDVDGIVYMAMSLRNVGSGIAVLHGWRVEPFPTDQNPIAAIQPTREAMVRPEPETFRGQGRDLYVPPGDISFWQAAIREPGDPDRNIVVGVIEGGQPLVIDLLYGDHEGGQRTISRFSVSRIPGDKPGWLCSVVRHWNLDRDDPR